MIICGCHWLELVGYGLLLCMCAYSWGWAILRPGVLRRTLSQMSEIELTNTPVKSGIVCPDVDCLLYGPG